MKANPPTYKFEYITIDYTYREPSCIYLLLSVRVQDVFNLLPDVNLQSFVRAVNITTNDQMLVVYVAALTRSIIALHNLITNKLQNRDAERSETKDKDAAAAKKKDASDDKKADTDSSKKDTDAKTSSTDGKESSSKK